MQASGDAREDRALPRPKGWGLPVLPTCWPLVLRGRWQDGDRQSPFQMSPKDAAVREWEEC